MAITRAAAPLPNNAVGMRTLRMFTGQPPFHSNSMWLVIPARALARRFMQIERHVDCDRAGPAPVPRRAICRRWSLSAGLHALGGAPARRGEARADRRP